MVDMVNFLAKIKKRLQQSRAVQGNFEFRKGTENLKNVTNSFYKTTKYF